MTKDQILRLLVTGAATDTDTDLDSVVETIIQRIDPDIDLDKIPLTEFIGMCISK
jgi:hypothetical protein